MNGVLFYAIVALLVVELTRPDRARAGAQIGLVAFAGVTWFAGVTMVAFSATAGLVAGGLAAGATAIASRPRLR